MTGVAVAGAGDVTATVGTKRPKDADSGAWTAGAVTVTGHAKLRAGNAQVVYRAVCTFVFAGLKGQTPIADTEAVTLSAAMTAKLQRGGNGVLLHGDSAEGDFGNKLVVSSTRRLRTS